MQGWRSVQKHGWSPEREWDVPVNKVEAIQQHYLLGAVLLYGYESWKGLKEIEERVRRFESGCLMKTMKIRWFDMVSKEQLRRRTEQQTIVEKLRVNRWRWFGHVLSMPDRRIPKHALRCRQTGRRRVGRPKDIWQRTFKRDLTEKGLDRADVETRVGDRDNWKKFIADLRAT